MQDKQRVARIHGIVINLVQGLVIAGSVTVMLFAVDEANRYRRNAMDLCAWHARRMNGDDPASPQATILWIDIISGDRVCPFCGQLHDDAWVSRNAWDSQVNALAQKSASDLPVGNDE